MTKVSLIIVSDSSTKNGKELLNNCVTTALYEAHIDIEVIVVDNHAVADKRYKVIPQPTPFNYNTCLNAGAKEATGNYLYFANNDLLFKKGSLSEIVYQMGKHKLGTASAICPKAHSYVKVPRGVYISHKVGQAFTGWGFMMKIEAYSLIGGLKDTCPFYCADNETVEQLKQYGIRHGLVKTTFIEHIGQQTQKHLDSETFFEYTVDSVKIFNKKYNQNIFNLNKEHGKTKD